MKNILKNFWSTLKSFKTASILNILGLSVAFFVFIIIMSQLYWEANFNRGIKNYRDIYTFAMEVDLGDGMQTNGLISRGLAIKVVESSPFIESHTPINMFSEELKYLVNESDKEFTTTPLMVTPEYIDIFSLECVDGDFSKFNEPNTIVIPESFAKRYFGEKSPVGEVVTRVDRFGQLEGTNEYIQTIVAVYKDLPNNSLGNNLLENIGDFHKEMVLSGLNYLAMFKLKRGVDANEAFAPAKVMIKETFGDGAFFKKLDLESSRLIAFSDLYFTDIPLLKLPTGNRSLSLVLLAVALLIISIAVINYINFFMALVPIRIRAININKVFGASTNTLRVNIIFEAIGIMIITFLLSLFLVNIFANTSLSEMASTSLKVEDNLVVVALTLLLAIIVGALSGLLPAWYITKFPPAMVLKGSFGRSKRGIVLRQILSTLQFTITTALIIVSAFIIIQNNYLQSADYGYNRDRVVTTKVSGKISSNLEPFQEKIAKSPMFEQMVFSSHDITHITRTWALEYDGKSLAFKFLPVYWNYPQSMGFELVEGRYFNESDSSRDKIGVAIFNEAAVREVGLKVGDILQVYEYSIEIVGIVKDFNYRSLKYSVGPACLYYGAGDASGGVCDIANIKLAPKTDMNEAITYIESALKEADPNMSESEISVVPLSQSIEKLYKRERQIADFIVIFSIIAILISLLGLFGMIIFDMQNGKKEVALRKIFGSTVADILIKFNRRVVKVLIVSTIVAIPISWFAVNEWLKGFSYRTQIYWWVFALAILFIFLLVIAIVTIQTSRAATANPVESLKSE